MLRLATPLAEPAMRPGEAQVGALALAIGADGAGGASARLGLVNLAAPEWHSSRGGLIDRRIVLDLGLARREEGGPVLDAVGGLARGMSTFGPRGQVIVIPTATIARIVPAARQGRSHRPRLARRRPASRRRARCAAPERRAIFGPDGDVGGRRRSRRSGRYRRGRHLLSVDGTSTQRWRKVARLFGSDSIGRKAEIA